MSKTPPFTITPSILNLSQDIGHQLGMLSGAKLYPVPVGLRKENKIKTIQSSLAIEGNTLTIDHITDIINGKRVIAPQTEIMEVKNAIEVYDNLSRWNPVSISDMKKSHALLMKGLTQHNGQWREGGVGIFQGTKLAHMAPPAKRVPVLMEELFNFLKKNKDISWLLKACIFHYELEFIHPFIDGNGRMGRLWQQLLLMKENEIFEYISVESIIKENQSEYYKVLAKCDSQGESTEFIIFALKQILITLKQYTESNISKVNDYISRLAYARERINDNWFTRKDYILMHHNISSATASRDLAGGVRDKILIKTGEKNTAKYRFSDAG